jgi:hypothetical protein
MTSVTGRVAFTASFPVEVLMKSAPAIRQTQLAFATFRKVPKSPVPKIVFKWASPQASLNAATSSYRRRPISCQHMMAANDDVDFLGSVLNRRSNFAEFGGKGTKTMRKTCGNRSNRNVRIFQSSDRRVDEGMIDTDGSNLKS